MVNKLHNIVEKYMIMYSTKDNWSSIRQSYYIYSYIVFLTLILIKKCKSLDDIKRCAIKYDIDDSEILQYVFSYQGCNELINEILHGINCEEIKELNCLYQEYLSVDYSVEGEKVFFSSGKNNRDVLGSYYTEESFAYEIAKKAIEDFLKKNKKNHKKIKVADLSCGGGAFLVAVRKYCFEKGIDVELYGYDVDPIAVMITKSRLSLCDEIGYCVTDIRMGNPLLKGKKGKNENNKIVAFKCAINGRYYNPDMGVDVESEYDIVVGNPPWEKIRFEEKKFLKHYTSMNNIESKDDRKKYVDTIGRVNYEYFESIMSDYEESKKQIKSDNDYIYTSCGELNTYALFTELAMNLLCEKGIAALIVKSSLLKMPVYSMFFKHLSRTHKLYEVYMFVNRKKIFKIDSREEFSVVFLGKENDTNINIAVNLDDYNGFYNCKKIEISSEILELINPETEMFPNIRSNEELQFLIDIYKNNKVFGDVYSNCKFGRLVHLTNHAEAIVKQEKEGYLAVYEGKFIELYTAKYATFSQMSENDKYKNKAIARTLIDADGKEYPESRFYIKADLWHNISKNFNNGYFVAWRSLTSATNRRTMLATLLPTLPTCQSIQVLQMDNVNTMIKILALFNSVVFDYIVRLKMAGLDLTQKIIKQIPVPLEDEFERIIEYKGVEASIAEHIFSRIIFLYSNDCRIRGAFENLNSYEIKKVMSRKQIIAEIDVLVGLLYKMELEEIKKIAGSFEKYYTKEEIGKWF